MASPSLCSSLCILISLFLIIIYPSHSSSELHISEDDAKHIANHQKVNLSLYYETLCPACEDFIVNDLVRVFTTDLKPIVNLHLVPYGNAKIKGPNKTVECQHDHLECYFNTIEACALDVWPLKMSFPFIHCVEKLLLQNKTEWVSCSKHLKLDPTSIKKCYESGRGKELILRNACETGRLNPPHRYVPWVTVNNKPIPDYEHFISYVCNAYKGHPKPNACKIGTISTKKIKATHPPCHANEELVSP